MTVQTVADRRKTRSLVGKAEAELTRSRKLRKKLRDTASRERRKLDTKISKLEVARAEQVEKLASSPSTGTKEYPGGFDLNETFPVVIEAVGNTFRGYVPNLRNTDVLNPYKGIIVREVRELAVKEVNRLQSLGLPVPPFESKAPAGAILIGNSLDEDEDEEELDGVGCIEETLVSIEAEFPRTGFAKLRKSVRDWFVKWGILEYKPNLWNGKEIPEGIDVSKLDADILATAENETWEEWKARRELVCPAENETWEEWKARRDSTFTARDYFDKPPVQRIQVGGRRVRCQS